MNLLIEGIKNGTVIKTTGTKKLVIDGKSVNCPIYEIKLDNLYYNDQNDRIATWISQYKADHGVDSISRDDINSYNSIIQGFIQSSNPDKMKETMNNIGLFGQQEPGVVLADGRIIDGNRRFTCLRELSKTHANCEYFDAVILDKDYECNAKQIKMLELQIQIGKEARVDYNPIDRLVGIYRDVVENQLLTPDEYAKSTNQKPSDVQKQIELATLLSEFLDAIHAPGEFYIARDLALDGPLNELYGVLKKISDEDKREEIKYIVFTNLLVKPDKDMTRFVRKLKAIVNGHYLDEFIERESELSEEVLDGLPDKVSSTDVNEVRANETVRDDLKSAMDLIDNKVKAAETRNKPNQVLSKAVDSIEGIDNKIIRKLTEEQQLDILDNVEQLEELLKSIRECLDV